MDGSVSCFAEPLGEEALDFGADGSRAPARRFDVDFVAGGILAALPNNWMKYG